MSKYKPYPKYKDSGVEWLGQVPKEWPVIRVGYGYDVVLGKMLQPAAKDENDQVVPYLKAANVQWENVTGEPSEMWASGMEVQKYSLRKGDLLVCEGGEVGRCALVPYHPDSIFIIQNSLHRVRATNSYNVTYLLRVLETVHQASWFDILCNKATIAHFTRDKFTSLRMPAPDLDVQEKIVEYLNQECSHIDTVISKQLQLISLLEEKRISIISYAVTKGLNPDAPVKDSGVEWLGKIPVHWEISTVGRGYDIVLGKMLQPEQRSDVDRQTPYLKAIHVNWENVLNTELPEMWATPYEIEKLSIDPGDLLVCEGGEVGRAAIASRFIPTPCIIQNALHRVRSSTGNNPAYLLRVLQVVARAEWFDILCNKATIAHFTREKFASLACPYPPQDEQKAIVNYLENELSKIDAIINKTRQAIALAHERRAAIISAAVTGKICVSRPQSADKALSKSLEYFQKVVLAAEITDQLHQERTFGRVKLQKILYLSEYHAQLPFQRSEYQRYAAGPHDPKAMYSIEGQMKKQKWFDSRRRKSGYGKEYVPLERHEAYKQYYERYFVEKHEVIQRIIDLLRPKDTQFCEVVATLYGVWNDFLLEGQQPDDAAMFREAVTNWAPEKKEVPPGLWPKALHWMRENSLVPTGWGEQTIHRLEA